MLQSFWAMSFVNEWLNLLFPPQCPICHQATPRHTLCSACHGQLPWCTLDGICLRCGRATSTIFIEETLTQGCDFCYADPWAPDQVFSPFLFAPPVSRLLVGLKFSDRTELVAQLIDLCWEWLAQQLHASPLGTIDCIVPIPLHFWRLIMRRYNQSALLAKELARRLHKPMSTTGLYRVQATTPQTSLGAQARRDNVAMAFRVDPEWAAQHAQQTILLVDDVMTTGSTLYAAISALKRAGIGRVVVFCMARVV